jgi:hypothetical protein
MTMSRSFCLLMILFLTACIDDIAVDLPLNTSGRLVIEGVAERSPDLYRFLIHVSRTKDLQGDQVGPLERDVAIFLIYNGTEKISLQNGVADTISIENFHRIYGGQPDDVRFNIQVETIDGKIFTAEEQKVLQGPTTANIALQYIERQELNDVGNDVERGYVKVLVNTPLLNAHQEKVSLRWDVSGVYRFPEVPWTDDPFFFPKTCFVHDFLPFNEVNVLNSNEIRGDVVEQFEIMETPADFRFASGYYFTVVQKAINTRAAEYWDQVRQSIEREGTIFDAPVGAIKSNIRQIEGESADVLGYFYTAGIDTLRHFATREETGGQFHLCSFQLVSEACCDCLLLVNSSLDKPSYWIQ